MSVGQPVVRVEGRRKVTGQARYTADIAEDGLVHAVSVGASVASGRITAMDTSAAHDAGGVLAIVTHHNAPRTHPVPGREVSGPAGDTIPILQDDRVYYAEQPVAVVVAHTLEQARYAASLVRVSYALEPAVATMYQRLGEAFESRYARPVVVGDVDSGFAQADVVVETTCHLQMQHQHPMELIAMTAHWSGDELTVRASTQSVGVLRAGIAIAFGLRPEQVRVTSEFLGGGFGGKASLWWPTITATMAARVTGRPVRLVVSRAQMVAASGHRARSQQRVRLGARRDGRLTAIDYDTITETSAWYDTPPPSITSITPIPYRSPAIRAIPRFVKVNTQSPTPMRSPHEGQGLVAIESAMDELAERTGLDPLELRRRNYADREPWTGKPWSSNGLLECYDLGARRFGWSRRDPKPRSMRQGGLLIGWGMSTAFRLAESRPASARAVLHADGTVLVQMGTQDIGTGTYTIIGQVAADAVGVTVDRVTAEIADTDLPPAPPSIGSFTAQTVSGTVTNAGNALRDKVINVAVADEQSPLYGAAPEQVIVHNGRMRLRDDPARGETYAELLRRNGLPAVDAIGQHNPPGIGEGTHGRYAFGVDFAEVRVDPSLGTVRVTRYVKVIEAGKIINPRTTRSQVIGGVTFGIGQALTEVSEMDTQHARIANASFWGYHVPVNADVPAIDAQFVEVDDPHVPQGVKGLGELCTIGAAPAIVNAVAHATGIRVRELPITADKLLG
ncbi:xanthine dehydrogenase molybdenum binding subunit apoprotein [Herbihabitans rhizosphaerae]|uniref:Xanthine dehydrogenase molybdenum binding subunit apoprotein n=1 Tax=Herbihabitans rhizosphaerae TaxID=1872711 RepID=A0A4Q7KJR7_9PSEU|nr:xanthine dehydrogenase family protein molybdopterin-binding subunit [Herbihabitans rhizosphaerae]RZS36434.1 xanthine dehydrogenase molybdenum binding subunit apoprotein [Herbihabitans rhizosphaerae]